MCFCAFIFNNSEMVSQRISQERYASCSWQQVELLHKLSVLGVSARCWHKDEAEAACTGGHSGFWLGFQPFQSLCSLMLWLAMIATTLAGYQPCFGQREYSGCLLGETQEVLVSKKAG